MENAIVSVLSAFLPQLVKTITCDRGSEFTNWRRMEEQLHCDVYFVSYYCTCRKAQTRVSMAFSGSSIRKVGIYPGVLLPP